MLLSYLVPGKMLQHETSWSCIKVQLIIISHHTFLDYYTFITIEHLSVFIHSLRGHIMGVSCLLTFISKTIQHIQLNLALGSTFIVVR